MAARWGLLIPLVAAAAIAALFLAGRPFADLTRDVPPVEDLAFEAVTLDGQGIHMTLRASGSEPVRIVQVQVDGAFWAFTQTPPGAVERLGRVRLDIPYPWVTGEAHAVTVLTATGVTFDHEIEVAVPTAPVGPATIAQLVVIGLFVGFVPILVGYGFMPGIRSFGPAGMDFALALTLGLLVFLLIDTGQEAFEFAARASGALNPTLAVWAVALLSCLVLLAIGRRGGGAPRGPALAFFIALGIGVHNLGEGIAIGASIAVGEVALASFLVMGFFLHNLSEGIAIAAPLERLRRNWLALVLLAVLAGGPASLGTVAGVFAFTPFRAALAFAIGAGAIAQVLIEIGALMLRRGVGARAGAEGGRSALPVTGGFTLGLAVMYATSILTSG